VRGGDGGEPDSPESSHHQHQQRRPPVSASHSRHTSASVQYKPLLFGKPWLLCIHFGVWRSTARSPRRVSFLLSCDCHKKHFGLKSHHLDLSPTRVKNLMTLDETWQNKESFFLFFFLIYFIRECAQYSDRDQRTSIFFCWGLGLVGFDWRRVLNWGLAVLDLRLGLQLTIILIID